MSKAKAKPKQLAPGTAPKVADKALNLQIRTAVPNHVLRTAKNLELMVLDPRTDKWVQIEIVQAQPNRI